MSQKKSKEARREAVNDEKIRGLAQELLDEHMTKLIGNTYDVITQMKASWTLEEKQEFCDWFMYGTEPSWVGLSEEKDDKQLELPLEEVPDDTGRESQSESESDTQEA